MVDANSKIGDELTRGELEALIDYHDSQESEADAMGYDECVPHHRRRRAEFQALLNSFAERCTPDRDAKSSLPQRGIEPGDENERLHYARIDSSSRVRSPLDHGPSTMNTIPQRGTD